MATEEVGAWVDRLRSLASKAAGLDGFEVRGEVREDRKYVMDGRDVKAVRRSRLGGVSLRAWASGASAYAFSTDPSPAAVDALVERTTRSALAGARQGARGFGAAIETRKATYRPSVKGHPGEASHEEVLALVRRSQEAALATAPGGKATSSFGFADRRVVRSDSAGSWVETASLQSTLFTQVVVREDGRFGEYLELAGGERGVGDYVGEAAPEHIGTEAARLARENSVAGPAPAGRHRVLTDHHLSGLLAHESFGHLTEFDLVAPGWSLLKGRRGERFASDAVSIVDAPVSPDGRRIGIRVPVDDEGTRGEAVRLLDRGELKAFLHVRGSAAPEGDVPTGNGRALDVRYPPIVRMRNTYFEPGESTFDEALEQLGDGLYLCGGRGGAPHSDGSFMFTSQRGYRVERGEIVAPVRGPSIYGNIFDFLGGIETLTSDFGIFTNYFGGCGKWDQSFLHVGVGGPHVLVREALVGGHA